MYQEEINDLITELLARDFVIVASDYEGSGTPGMYAWSQSSALGKNILDAARAAQNFNLAKANKDTFITGFSIGGHAMSKANEIADVYSPETNLLGVIGILAGVIQSDWVAEMLMHSSYTRGYMVFGAAVEEAIWGKELAPLSRRLTDLAISHLGVLENQCMTETNDYFGQFEAEELFKFPFNPKFTSGVDPSVVNAIGQKKGAAPVVLIHPIDDPAIPPAAIIEYVEKVCQFEQDILIRWHAVLPHSLSMLENQAVMLDFFDFIDSILAGSPTETHCGNIPDLPGESEVSANMGVPCNIFDSQENAEIFFNTNPELGAGLDTNGDGIACGLGDTHGLVDCGDGTTLLGHRCWFSFVETCNNFQTQAEAQEWFDLQSGDTGTVDQNEDGIACGSGDWAGERDCINGLVLERLCQGGSTKGEEEEALCPSGVGMTAGMCNGFFYNCGSFSSQEDAQTWFEVNLDFGENADTNNDGTACGQGDFGGLNACLNSEDELVLDHLCI
jgi:hypothetical protein